MRNKMPATPKLLSSKTHDAQRQVFRRQYSISSRNGSDDEIIHEPIFHQATFATSDHSVNRNNHAHLVENNVELNNANVTESGNSVLYNDHNHNNNNNNSFDDVPANLYESHSNIPGMTPEELLAEHRRSLAEVTHQPEESIDFHSLTLSRHQISPQLSLNDLHSQEKIIPIAPNGYEEEDVTHTEYADVFKDFHFGDDNYNDVNKVDDNDNNNNYNNSYSNSDIDNKIDNEIEEASHKNTLSNKKF